MRTHAIAPIALAILVSGCMRFDPLRGAIGSYRNYTDVNARIDNGVLHDPYGRFSIRVPRLVEPGAVIRGRLEKEGGTVQFSDDFGKLIRIDVSTANDPTSMAMLTNPDWQAVFSQNRAFMQGLYRTVSPQAEVVHQEYVTRDNKHVDFYVFTMPEGSTLADASTRKRHDALRASVSLLDGASLFTLSTQYIVGIWGENEEQSESIGRMKTILLDTLDTVSFKQQEGQHISGTNSDSAAAEPE